MCSSDLGTIGENEDGVVRAHIAVDANPVEGALDRFENSLLQAGLAHVGVGGDEAKHGCHAGADHARSLCAGTDANFPTTDGSHDGNFLDGGVAGHDGLGNRTATPGTEMVGELVEAGSDAIHGHGQTDDAC